MDAVLGIFVMSPGMNECLDKQNSRTGMGLRRVSEMRLTGAGRGRL